MKSSNADERLKKMLTALPNREETVNLFELLQRLQDAGITFEQLAKSTIIKLEGDIKAPKVINLFVSKLNDNTNQEAVFLFLDDIREPEHAFEYTKQEMFLNQGWEVVRNFDEFKSHIEKNGLPNFISFDHDLADTHYTPEYLWTDYDKSKEWQEQLQKEKTGYECAVWLVDYCIDNNLQLPKYYCHSMNPVGKDKIVGLLRSFQNSR